MSSMPKQMGARGFTLTEVLACMVLLAVALAPVVQCLASAQVTGTHAQRATEAVFLAERKIEDIRAILRESFETDVSISSEPLSGRFLCTVSQMEEGQLLRSVSVVVGYDEDRDGSLDADEIVAALDTKVADRM